ncbi:uncharacterized protein LOC131206895 [Anopheles bellator]|uniref:uncharacterized protein LOC131206895 n=1 Tax=Anopheles bellator TaxID=139047 RepID=UPI002649641E|nr:uncharacterized protein LOC131206895 [Anopheles bellator]
MWSTILLVVPLLGIGYAAEIRLKRQGFAPAAECIISEADIDEIVQLTKMLDGRRSKKRPSNRAPTAELTDGCTRKLAEFKTSIQDVLARYGTMKKEWIKASEYELLKAKQESEISDLLREVDNLEREAEQRYRAELEKLRNSLQRLHRQLNENLRQLEQERLAGRRAQEALCVTNIQGGRAENAVRIFRALNGSYDTVRVTNDTYRDDRDMVEPLVEFFKALRDDAQTFDTIGGLEELHKQLERNNQLDLERSRTIFHSLVGLENYYTADVDVVRVQKLRIKLMDTLRALRNQ